MLAVSWNFVYLTVTLRYVGRQAALLWSSRNAIRSIATFHLLIKKGDIPVVTLRLFSFSFFAFFMQVAGYLSVMLNTHLPLVKIDREIGPPLGRTWKVIHPRFSWRSNRELNDTFFPKLFAKI